jgi:hypothetical protein
MYEIKLITLDDTHFQVTLTGNTTTTHQVTVQAGYAQKLAAGKITTAQLVQKSFKFLLARESNTSILRSFDLSVIARYFPEYESVISE